MIKFKLVVLLALMFATYTTTPMNMTDADVVSDVTVKNNDINAEGVTKGCNYIRSFTVRKKLEKDPSKDASLQHEYIYYHCVECLNIDLHEMRAAYVTFSYDDQNLREDQAPTVMALPTGCPAPILPRKKTACENGIELGKHLVSDVTEIVTKQMVENPLNLQLDPTDPNLDTEKMNEVTVQLNSIQEKIKEALENYHDDMPNTPDSTVTTPEGVNVETFSFPNSQVVVTTRGFDNVETGPESGPETGPGSGPETGPGSGPGSGPETGSGSENFPEPGTDDTPIEVMHFPPFSGVVVDENGQEVVVGPEQGAGPEQLEPGVTMLPRDLSKLNPGTYHSKNVRKVVDKENPDTVLGYEMVEVKISADPRTHETKIWKKDGPSEDAPWVFEEYIHRVPAVVDASKISEARYPPVGEPLVTLVENPLRFVQPETPNQVDIPVELFDSMGNVAQGFTDALENIVTEKAECLLDKIFHQKKYEIELVCSKTAAESDKNAILKNELVRKLFCPEGNCDEFYQETVDRMIAHVAAGESEATFKIDKKTYIGELTPGAAQ